MPKIVLIGAGSVCFGYGTIYDLLLYKEVLAGSELCLVDIDPRVLRLMTGLAHKMNEREGSPFRITSSTQRQEVLEGADYVITSPAIQREARWEKDWNIIHGAGIKQTYGENGGPGSLSHTLRIIPLMLSIFRDVEQLAPNAMVINFSNPETRICMLLDRYTNLKFVGLCHQIYEAYRTVSTVTGIPAEDLDVKAAGINHFTWVYDIRRPSTGESILAMFREKLHGMPETYEPMSRKMDQLYGMFPTAGDHHLAEFLSYGWEFQGLHGRDFSKTNAEKKELMDWLERVDSGAGQLEEKVTGKSNESVADIIVAIASGKDNYEISLDLRNNGLISNLPDHAIVEVPGIVSPDAVRGLKMGALPEGIAAMMRQQIAIQGLSVEAAVTGSRKLALQAMLLDPVIDNWSVAETVLDQLLEAHREYVHPGFFA